MLEHLNRKKALRAKILMQNVLKRQIPPRNFTEERCIAMSFESVFPSFSVVFPLLLRNLEISTQESNANSTEISIYKTQFLTCNSERKGKERFFIKTLLQKCFKTASIDRLHHSMIKE